MIQVEKYFPYLHVLWNNAVPESIAKSYFYREQKGNKYDNSDLIL